MSAALSFCAMHKDIINVAPPALSELNFAQPLSLFLDFDGTLVDIASAPDNVIIPNDLTSNLTNISKLLGGRLAIVTGRPLAALDGFLGPNEIEAIGSHGIEYRGAPLPPPPLSEASMASIARLKQAWPNIFIEPKPFGVAVHYRQEPDAASSVTNIMNRIAEFDGLSAKLGKMLVELGPPHADKGKAVQRLMAKPPFTGSLPIFIGDDVTDEDGFAAVAQLGGFGILVGEPRPSAARYILPNPSAVLRWLKL